MRPTLDEIRTVGDLATTYQWSLSFSKFPTAVSGFALQGLNVRCVSTTIPTSAPSVISVNVRGHVIHQPGPVIYTPTIDLTFMETVDNMVSRFFAAWREACSEVVTGVHRVKNDVTAIVDLVRLDREHKPIWVYTLTGAWISGYTIGTLGGEASNLQPSMVLTYDYFKDNAAESSG